MLAYMFVSISPKYTCISLTVLKLLAVKEKTIFNPMSWRYKRENNKTAFK